MVREDAAHGCHDDPLRMVHQAQSDENKVDGDHEMVASYSAGSSSTQEAGTAGDQD